MVLYVAVQDGAPGSSVVVTCRMGQDGAPVCWLSLFITIVTRIVYDTYTYIYRWGFMPTYLPEGHLAFCGNGQFPKFHDFQGRSADIYIWGPAETDDFSDVDTSEGTILLS